MTSVEASVRSIISGGASTDLAGVTVGSTGSPVKCTSALKWQDTTFGSGYLHKIDTGTPVATYGTLWEGTYEIPTWYAWQVAHPTWHAVVIALCTYSNGSISSLGTSF